MIKRLEQLHKNGYVHRDLKGSNIMVGPSSTGDLNYLYIIDFSVTKKWTPALNDTELLKWKIAYNISLDKEDHGSLPGAIKFAPIAAHLPGYRFDKRDDLETLFYVLKDLRTHDLPWKDIHKD